MRTKARFIAVMTAVLMVFAMMPMVAFGADDTAGENVKEYELWVGGTQVTSANCENIPAAAGHTEYSGKASYDPDTNTLTLDDYKYTGMGRAYGIFRCGIDCRIDDLTVELKGDSVVTQSGLIGNQDSSVGMRIWADGVKIKGPGSLTLNAKGADGQHISYGLVVNNKSMEITGGTVTANAYASRYYCDGIHCEGNGGMNITGGSLIATAEEQTSHDDPIFHSAGIGYGTLTVGANAGKVILSGHTVAALDCTIKNEKEGKGWTNFEGTEGETAIPVNTEGATYDYKKIQFDPTPYDLWVGGTQVTSENCENIPAAAGHTEYSGKASYDPNTNTLTLDNYKYTGMGRSRGLLRYGIDCRIDDLTVELKGDSVVTQSGLIGNQDSSVGMRIWADGVKIKGPGSLTLNAKGADGQHISYGLVVNNKSMEITGGTVTANAYASKYYCDGIYNDGYGGGINITGGSLIATAEEQTSHDDPIFHSAGIRYGTLTVGANAGKVILSGHTAAVSECTIKNEMEGKGWTNFEGTEGGKVIPVNTEGTSYDYKKIEFPLKQISYKVTFKVAGGSWNDGTTAEKTVTLTGYEGDTLKLAADQIPAVGSKPNKNYKAGSWDKAPGTETAITSDTTYTYTYAEKDSISAKVTFKVENGSWDDGTAEEKTVTLTGYEGDTLKLDADQIPKAGSKPDKNYKAGSWDKAPGTETAITSDTTYTYTYAEKDSISAKVTFKVVGGAWDDGTAAEKTVTLTGYEGDTLKLDADQIPSAGSKPDKNRKAGSWDKAPGAETAITGDTTYTYTYAKKKSAPVTGTLLTKMTAKGSNSLALSWNRIKGVDGYDIFFAKCGKEGSKKVKTIKGSTTLKWTKKGLKKGTAYRAVVKAYVMKGGKKTYVRTGPMVHAYTSGGTEVFTNPGSVTVGKTSVSLKAGKKYRIKAKVNKLQKGKKLMPSGHAPKLRYISSNKRIATVSRSGKITAKAKGSCKVYALAVNGVSKAVKVTVK